MRRAEDSILLESVGQIGSHDAACVRRVLQGDQRAAQALFERLQPRVTKLVRCYVSRRTSSEDLAQSVFLKIFKNLHQFSGMVPLEHWVSRIAVNTCLNELRLERRRREFRLADLSEHEQAFVEKYLSDPAASGETTNVENTELVHKLLEELRPDERLLLRLLHLEQRSTSEISRATGWSVSLVKVKAFRARLKLRKLARKLLGV